jgi:4-hydroxybenzoate polyprenyltransferase
MDKKPQSVVVLLLRQMRLHQWVKNLLLFVPLILAHQIAHTDRLVATLIAALAFSLLASAVYTVNDLVDRSSDAEHPRKRFRPLASGALRTGQAIALAVVLVVASATLAGLACTPTFWMFLGLYAVSTTAYSLWLKRVVLVDVVVLSLLYTLRIIAGGEAASVEVTSWLLILSIFLFSSLAFLKRYTELHETVERDGHQVSGRGYHVGDVDFVLMAGVALGFLSVLVFALYVGSSHVQSLYASPQRLWAAVPLLLYWIGMMWLAAHRGRMHDDPIIFALRDRASYIVGLSIAIVLWWASV